MHILRRRQRRRQIRMRASTTTTTTTHNNNMVRYIVRRERGSFVYSPTFRCAVRGGGGVVPRALHFPRPARPRIRIHSQNNNNNNDAAPYTKRRRVRGRTVLCDLWRRWETLVVTGSRDETYDDGAGWYVRALAYGSERDDDIARYRRLNGQTRAVGKNFARSLPPGTVRIPYPGG